MTIIVLTKAGYISYHPPPPPYLHSPLMCLLCVCSNINILISYIKVSVISEGGVGLLAAMKIAANKFRC